MSCVSPRLRRRHLLWGMELSLELLQALRGQWNYQIIRHQKWEAFSYMMAVLMLQGD